MRGWGGGHGRAEGTGADRRRKEHLLSNECSKTCMEFDERWRKHDIYISPLLDPTKNVEEMDGGWMNELIDGWRKEGRKEHREGGR